jgi:hypothetical protein
MPPTAATAIARPLKYVTVSFACSLSIKLIAKP